MECVQPSATHRGVVRCLNPKTVYNIMGESCRLLQAYLEQEHKLNRVTPHTGGQSRAVAASRSLSEQHG